MEQMEQMFCKLFYMQNFYFRFMARESDREWS